TALRAPAMAPGPAGRCHGAGRPVRPAIRPAKLAARAHLLVRPHPATSPLTAPPPAVTAEPSHTSRGWTPKPPPHALSPEPAAPPGPRWRTGWRGTGSAPPRWERAAGLRTSRGGRRADGRDGTAAPGHALSMPANQPRLAARGPGVAQNVSRAIS